MNFVISCRIVDKRPNGNLVLEGTWSVSDNEENWEYSLSGEIRPEDIKPDNTVISDTIADLRSSSRKRATSATAIAAAGPWNGSTSGSRSRSKEQ